MYCCPVAAWSRPPTCQWLRSCFPRAWARHHFAPPFQPLASWVDGARPHEPCCTRESRRWRWENPILVNTRMITYNLKFWRQIHDTNLRDLLWPHSSRHWSKPLEEQNWSCLWHLPLCFLSWPSSWPAPCSHPLWTCSEPPHTFCSLRLADRLQTLYWTWRKSKIKTDPFAKTLIVIPLFILLGNVHVLLLRVRCQLWPLSGKFLANLGKGYLRTLLPKTVTEQE